MGNEIWKDVVGYEGLYECSNIGRVRSLEKKDYMDRNNCFRVRKGIILKQSEAGDYNSVSLYKNKKPRTFLVHRILAIAFIPNTDNKREVNHKNGIKKDNKISNLEWMTSSENTIHAIKNGLVNQKRGEDIVTSKLTEKQAIDIKYSKLKVSELSKMYNISASVVSSIRNGMAWKHL